jgi:hypothetical protein
MADKLVGTTLLAIAFAAAPTQPQQEIARQLTDKVYHAKSDFDEAGNLVSLLLRHEDHFRQDQPEKPGIDNADMQKLLCFLKLRRLEIWTVPVDGDGLKVLPELTELGHLELRELYQRAEVQPDFVLFLNDMPQLKWLDLMHWFGLEDFELEKLNGLPNLEVLNLDKPAAHREVVNFVAKCPKLKALGLHRVPLTEEEFAELLAAAPNLEGLLLRHTFNDRKGSRDQWRALRLMVRARKLKHLNLGDGYSPPYAWEDGLKHLVNVPSLEVLNMKAGELDDPAIGRFAEARQDVRIVKEPFPWDP